MHFYAQQLDGKKKAIEDCVMGYSKQGKKWKDNARKFQMDRPN